VLSSRENGRFVKKFLFVCLQEFTSTGTFEKFGIFVKVVQVYPKYGGTYERQKLEVRSQKAEA
jgi:hypothetical protein